MMLNRGEQDMDRAEECFWTAISLDPYMAHAFGNLGSLYFKLQRPVLAKPCAERAIQLDPAMKDKLKDTLGFISLDLKDYEERGREIITRMDKAHEMRPDDPRPIVDKAYIYGLSLEDYDKALEVIEQIPPEAIAGDSLVAYRVRALKERIARVQKYWHLVEEPLPELPKEINQPSR